MKAICIDLLNPLAMHVIPDSGLNPRNQPWFVPDDMAADAEAVTYAGALVSRLGMHIRREFARRYYTGLVQALHMRSASADPVAEWCRDACLVADPRHLDAADADPQMLDTLDAAIEAVSRYMTLKTGDMVLMRADIAPLPVTPGIDIGVAVLPALGEMTLKIR